MEGKLKVWVNGSFDILHIGHLRLLEFASQYGSVRVGVDSDRRIKEKKGPRRPFNTLEDRVSFLSSIKYVDSVVTFDSDDELRQRIKEYETDIMVIGNDYKSKPVIGVEYANNIIFFPKIEQYSTTAILQYEKDISNRGSVY